MKVLLVEDQKSIRDFIKDNVALLLPKNTCFFEAESVNQSIEFISREKPDLIFLDIEIIGGTGFDVLSKFPNLPSKIIFVTYLDEFAIDAFKYSATDYVLKPIRISDLKQATLKALSAIKKDNGVFNDVVLQNHSERKKRIIINTVEEVLVFDLDNLIRFEADDCYCTIYSNDQKAIASKPLKHFESIIDKNPSFLKVSRSNIVNINYIKKLNKKDNLIFFKDKSFVSFSESYKKAIINALK